MLCFVTANLTPYYPILADTDDGFIFALISADITLKIFCAHHQLLSSFARLTRAPQGYQPGPLGIKRACLQGTLFRGRAQWFAGTSLDQWALVNIVYPSFYLSAII